MAQGNTPGVLGCNEGLGGWQSVPIAPTTRMLDAALDAMDSSDAPEDDCASIYSAMLAAAPKPAERVPLDEKRINELYLVCHLEVAQLELERRYTFAGWFPIAVRLVEQAHGIGKPPNDQHEGPEASAACRRSLSMRQLGAGD